MALQCDNGGMRMFLAAISVMVSLALTSPVVAQSRVMPLGDSITEAETGYSSYRYWLWHGLLAFRAGRCPRAHGSRLCRRFRERGHHRLDGARSTVTPTSFSIVAL